MCCLRSSALPAFNFNNQAVSIIRDIACLLKLKLVESETTRAIFHSGALYLILNQNLINVINSLYTQSHYSLLHINTNDGLDGGLLVRIISN
jgi:hypothetical protein